MFKDYDELIKEMEREMQRLADQAFAGLIRLSDGPDRFWYPRVDVFETATHVMVMVEVAGLDKERYQIELAADNSSLIIRGSRAELAADRQGRLRCQQLEIYFGPFERSVALPRSDRIDRNRVEATYYDGLLRVILPFRAPRRGRVLPGKS